MKRRLVAATVAIVGTAVLLAGCGGGGGRLSKSQYEQKLQQEGKALQAAFASIGTNTTSLKDLARNVAKARDAATKAADDLAKVNPPKDAAADNGRLVKALRVISDDMGKLKKAAENGDQAAAARVSQDLGSSPALQDAKAATDDLKKKGYRIGVLGQ